MSLVHCRHAIETWHLLLLPRLDSSLVITERHIDVGIEYSQFGANALVAGINDFIQGFVGFLVIAALIVDFSKVVPDTVMQFGI